MNDNNNEFENQNNLEQDSNSKPSFDDFSYSKNAKKAIVPMFIGIFTMVLLTIGATWAYYNVKIEGSITGSSVTAKTAGRGVVTLKSGTATASLSLSASDMSSATASTSGKIWYASATGRTETNTPISLGTATLSGDESTYSCNYTITAKATTDHGLTDAFGSNATGHSTELILELDTGVYDFTTGEHATKIASSSGIVFSGKFEVSKAQPTKSFTAKFYLKNTNNTDQAFAAGKTETISITTAISDCALKA